MLTQFFQGQLKLLLKRCSSQRDQLRTLRPRLPRELYADIQELRGILMRAEAQIRTLLVPRGQRPRNLLKNQFDEYEREVEEVEQVEQEGLTLLDHYNEKDKYLYHFQKRLCAQIGYSYKLPLICGHS